MTTMDRLAGLRDAMAFFQQGLLARHDAFEEALESGDVGCIRAMLPKIIPHNQACRKSTVETVDLVLNLLDRARASGISESDEQAFYDFLAHAHGVLRAIDA